MSNTSDSSTTAITDNPLLANSGLPLFDQIRPEHVEQGIKHVLQQAEQIFQEAEANAKPEWESLFTPMNRIGKLLQYSWQPVGHLLGVANSPELRTAYESVQDDVVAFGMKTKQSQPIYAAMKKMQQPEIWETLSEVQQRILTESLLDAEQAGIGLQDKERERFNQIVQELSQLATQFSNNVLDSTKAYSLLVTNSKDTKGLPDSLKAMAAQSHNSQKEEGDAEATPETGPWRITLEAPSCLPFLKHCQNRDLREQVYRAFITRSSTGDFDNQNLCVKILKLRNEKAKLLGYKNHAEVSLAQKMAPDVNAIMAMYETLQTASWEPAKQDIQDVEQLAKQSDSSVPLPLAHWDIAFWAERLREERYNITDEQLRPYFPHDRVLQGLFDLLKRLFKIRIEAADGKAPVWNKDVQFFNVFDCSEGTTASKQLASFYYDPYSRPENKRGGAWMNDCLGRDATGDDVQLPVAHLVCNCTPPVGDQQALMTFREVETLFHEFGHGLQHMLTTVDHPEAAGINGVEWDAVELPSQFMENWCYHKPTLLGLTAHVETGKQLPDELFEKLVAAKNYRAGSDMLRQLTFGMTDIKLHSSFNTDGDLSVFDIQKEVMKKTSVLPMLAEDRMLCSFQHIFAGGYAAGYYSYKWAEVLSADAFSAFEDVGLENDDKVQEVGMKFRETVLSLGGGRHPMEVFKQFRGRKPDANALLRHGGLID